MAREPQHDGDARKGRQFWAWLRDAGMSWYQDDVMRLSSSLAYYTLLALAPLLLLAVSIAGLFVGTDAARGQIAEMLSTRLGKDAGHAIESIIEAAGDPHESVAGTLVSLVVLVIGASAVFGELQAAMNRIWQVRLRPGRGLRGMVRDRCMCFAMVGSVALLLLLLLVVGALLALLGSRIGSLPGGTTLWQVVDLLLSVVAVTLLCALVYKTVPDIKIPLREVWPGALLTAGMFVLSEIAIGLYLRYSIVPKPQGVAGSFVVVVMWVYYSGQILFYGAEFTKVRAAARGVPVAPRRHAIRLPERPKEDAVGEVTE